jgi:hypothetical protein
VKPAPTLLAISVGFGALYAAGCSMSSSSSSSMAAPLSSSLAPMRWTGRPPSPDPRVGLRAGKIDSTGRNITVPAAEAAWNIRLVSNSPTTEGFKGVTNSDLAFSRNWVFQGNYNGYQVWDITNPARPRLATSYLCPASQSDVSVYKNILFVSSENATGRTDCGTEADTAVVSQHRIRGIRIFDITDMNKPKYLANVQTCRGSHTHTVVSDPKDANNIYIYISGSSQVRPEGELKGCADLSTENNPNSSNFRIEVIKVPLADPSKATLVSAPRIFQDLAAAPRAQARVSQDSAEQAAAAAARGGAGRGGRGGAGGGRGGRGGAPQVRQGPTQCHDITVYPYIGLAGGACGGYGLLLDIRDVANPVRIDAAADSNYSFWHSATFSNDGSKILFTDEWGGGSAPRCRASDKYEWGANALFTIENRKMHFKSYYKMPAAQTSLENCVAHNGSLIPIPGREVMVQGWYQGGISVFDWSDISHPIEIAFFDRGPVDDTRLRSAGSWSIYWYNGLLVSSEINRGLDIFELQPSAFLTQNEIDAAKTVRHEFLNAQEQPHFVWPASFAKSRAFVDQLERSGGLSSARIVAVREAFAGAEKASGTARLEALRALAAQLDGEASSSADGGRVRMLAQSARELAK